MVGPQRVGLWFVEAIATMCRHMASQSGRFHEVTTKLVSLTVQAIVRTVLV